MTLPRLAPTNSRAGIEEAMSLGSSVGSREDLLREVTDEDSQDLTRFCELHESQKYAKTCCARHFVLKNVKSNIFKDETCRRTLPAACHESPESRIIAGEQVIRRTS